MECSTARAFMPASFCATCTSCSREKIPFLIRICMNPLLFLFVFTYIMPHMSGSAALNPTAAAGRRQLLHRPAPRPHGRRHHVLRHRRRSPSARPGVRHHPRDRRPRYVSALPVAAVAIEKIVFSAVQSVIAAAIVFPLAYYVPATPVYAHVNSWPFLILVLTLASLTAGALGLVIGTSVKPQQIGLIFGTVVMPITFLGCVYYPWAKLDKMPILQHAVLINPIVYMSEGLRAAVTPTLPHMDSARIVAMLWFFLVLLTCLGIKGFTRRVIG
jgi:ABC-2 type transport system permease protein